MYKRFLIKLCILLSLAVSISSIAFSQSEDTSELSADFNEMLASFRVVLDQLALEVAAHKQWFKDYQSQILVANGDLLTGSLDEQLSQIERQIESLEKSTKGSWIYLLSKQLDSYISMGIPASELRSWMESQDKYIIEIQNDVSVLEQDIEQIKQASETQGEPSTTITVGTSDGLESTQHLTTLEEQSTLETSLLYLLTGLEVWGSWLDPNNTIGLLPEAEGRFMTSGTPVLQAGGNTIPGGIGVIGFAGPIIISHDGIPQGFAEENSLSEPLAIDYDDSIEDVLEQVSYLDRLNYQFGIEISSRTVQIYRKPLATELTLLTALQRIGVPTETAEIWLQEYAEIAYSAQTIQLAWLVADNPLARDYQAHISHMLEVLDLNALLTPNQSTELSLPEVPDSSWVSARPFLGRGTAATSYESLY